MLLPENYTYHWDYKEGFYSIKQKIGNQTVRVEFWSWQQTRNTIHWNICLVCFNKRKDIDKYLSTPHTTGHNGIENLLQAKYMIWNFEQVLKDEWSNYTHIIYCTWLDNRRRDVYYRGLKSLGYDFGVLEGQKVLMKKIDFSTEKICVN